MVDALRTSLVMTGEPLVKVSLPVGFVGPPLMSIIACATVRSAALAVLPVLLPLTVSAGICASIAFVTRFVQVEVSALDPSVQTGTLVDSPVSVILENETALDVVVQVGHAIVVVVPVVVAVIGGVPAIVVIAYVIAVAPLHVSMIVTEPVENAETRIRNPYIEGTA